MSWCRFSTICENNKSADIYLYEDVAGGVTVHLASKRRLNEELAPRMPNLSDVTPAEWIMANHKREDWLGDNAPFVEIYLPYAGKTHNFTKKEKLLKFLDKLKELGYNFPEHVFEIANEWKESGNKHEL